MIYDKAPKPTDDTTDTDSTYEQQPKVLHLEYDPKALVQFGAEQEAAVQGVIESMRAAGKDQREIEFAVYHELEAMGIDLASAHEGAVAVEAVYEDGHREPRAMNIGTEDFGTMIRRAELHEVVAKTSEYPENQEQLLHELSEDVAQIADDFERSIDLDQTEVPRTMLSDYKDRVQAVLHSIYRGQVNEQILRQFAGATHDIRRKYLAEAHLRTERVRKADPEALTEQVSQSANRSFDDDNVGIARNKVSKLRDGLLEARTALRIDGDSAVALNTRLGRILNEVEETLNDRYGTDAHLDQVKAQLTLLESAFEDDTKARNRVHSVIDQLKQLS